MQRELWTHTTTLTAAATSTTQARQFVRQRLDEHALSSLSDSIALVASEFSVDALEHGRFPFILELHGNGISVVLSVREQSDGVIALPRRPDALPIDGRGLQLARSLSDGCGVAHSGHQTTIAWARFDLASPTRNGVHHS